MGIVTRPIPTLINGVSQQPDSLRLPTQHEASNNCYASVVEGLKDRPPTEHIAKLYDGNIGNAHAHLINRDSVERYQVLLWNGDLSVHDLAGNVKTVSFPNGKTYLDTTTPRTSMKCLTVQDYTFILNTTKTPTMGVGLTTVRLKEGLIFVRQGNYGSDYKVFIDGVQQAIKTTSVSNVADIATNLIAEDLKADLVTNLGGGYTITRAGSVVHITKNTGDFRLTVEDSQGGSSLLCFKDSTQNFTTLPTTAPTGFEITINGTADSEYDHYYIRFVPATSGETFGEGYWEECVGQGVANTINPANMPHVLIRNGDGTFTFKEADWDAMTAGDSTLSPPPSFIGRPINGMYFSNQRFSLLAGDSIIRSGTGAFFNFFRTTMTTFPDSDPIDYKVSHTKVSNLKNAVAYDEKVIIVSEQTQFVAQGNTPKTFSVDPSTEFECSPLCAPVGAGRNVYFAFTNGEGDVLGYDGIREYSVDRSTDNKDAIDITSQVPKYIPNGTFKLISSTTVNILIALTEGDAPAMYLYKYFYANQDKLQSAWMRIDFAGDDAVVLGGEFIASTLYLVIQHSDGVYLERMNFSPGRTDPGVNFVTHLDRRVTDEDCVSVTYDSLLNRTTWTLPYVADSTVQVVSREENPGIIQTLINAGGLVSTIIGAGDLTGLKVYLGQKYRREVDLSKLYLRQENSSGGSSIITAGRLQIRTITFTYANTGTFNVTIEQDFRDPSSYSQVRDPQDTTFTGRVLGAGSNLIGAVALATGEFTVPVLAENLKVRIKLWTESFLPMSILSAEWEGFYNARGFGARR